MRLARLLDPIEIRVLGALLEKQQSTPEYYPLTVNALVAACNQKSNREPVMDLSEGDVVAALERLREHVLVWKVEGMRAERWEHNLDARWELDAPAKAVLTLLFLRGEQTPGELRTRSERLHAFASVAEVEATLARLAKEADPLLCELPRRPGQKESRFTHLAGNTPPGTDKPLPIHASDEPDTLTHRIARLENRVAELAEELAALRKSLGE